MTVGDMDDMRDTLIKLFTNRPCEKMTPWSFANYLIANGVIVTPCFAMIEQFIKDGKFDTGHTAHNGRIAVVYIDKSKWSCPLIDITEQFYNTSKAVERIEALKDNRQ